MENGMGCAGLGLSSAAIGLAPFKVLVADPLGLPDVERPLGILVFRVLRKRIVHRKRMAISVFSPAFLHQGQHLGQFLRMLRVFCEISGLVRIVFQVKKQTMIN